MISTNIWDLIASQFIATMGGVAVVFIVDLISNAIFKTKEKLFLIIEEISIVLNNEAKYYSNPINTCGLSKNMYDEYKHSSNEVRRVASKLLSFSQLYNRIYFSKITINDVKDAGSLLIGVSNGYFDDRNVFLNDEKAKKAKELLGIE